MPKIKRHQLQVQRVMAQIDKCLSQDPIVVPKMTDIAKAAGASSFHLHRLFAALVGETPIEYFNKRRLERAALVLKDGKPQSLLQFALALGFEGHASFATAFQKRYGTSPSEFSKNPSAKYFKVGGPRPFLAAKQANSAATNVSTEDKKEFRFVYRSQSGVRDGRFFADDTVPLQLAQMMQSRAGLGIIPAASFPISPERLNQDNIEGHFGGLDFGRNLENWSQLARCFAAGKWLVQKHFGEFRFLHQTWNRAYQSLLSNEQLSLRDQWPIEIYLQSAVEQDSNQPSAEVWLPIN